jgi:hypothetical protein
LHVRIESPIVLLNPEGTVEAVRINLLGDGCSLTSYLLGLNLNEKKICDPTVADLRERIGRGLVEVMVQTQNALQLLRGRTSRHPNHSVKVMEMGCTLQAPALRCMSLVMGVSQETLMEKQCGKRQ